MQPVILSDYYPCGGERTFATGDPNQYKFTGKERDAETGLDYFGARFYGSSLGRWLSTDWNATPTTVPYADFSDPQTLNLYGYVRNNPITTADADGHCPPCDVEPDIGDLPSSAELEQAAAEGAKFIRNSRAGGLAAAGALVVGSFYLAATRTTDAYVANKNDDAKLAAQESRTAAENREHQKEAEAQAGGAGARKGGGRDDPKINEKRERSAASKADQLREQRDQLRSKPNKTPADKAQLKKVENQLKREIQRQQKSETHGRKQKGQQDQY